MNESDPRHIFQQLFYDQAKATSAFPDFVDIFNTISFTQLIVDLKLIENNKEDLSHVALAIALPKPEKEPIIEWFFNGYYTHLRIGYSAPKNANAHGLENEIFCAAIEPLTDSLAHEFFEHLKNNTEIKNGYLVSAYPVTVAEKTRYELFKHNQNMQSWFIGGRHDLDIIH